MTEESLRPDLPLKTDSVILRRMMQTLQRSEAWWKVSASGQPSRVVLSTAHGLIDNGLTVLLKGIDWSTLKPIDSLLMSCLIMAAALQLDNRLCRAQHSSGKLKFVEALKQAVENMEGKPFP